LNGIIKKRTATFKNMVLLLNALSRYDDEHSEDEDRWVLLGNSLNETLLLVVHTFRDKNGVEFTRIISARKATKQEQKAYQRRCPS
jgi:uncharacterized DUF497 family protein